MYQTVEMCRAEMTSNNDNSEVYDFFYGLSKFIYIVGGPNFWPEQLKLPICFDKIHKQISVITHTISVLLITLQYGALYTQTNLSEKQKWDSLIIPVSNTIVYCYTLNSKYYAETFKDVFRHLAIDSKKNNDKEIDRETIKRMKFFSGVCLSLVGTSWLSYGIEGIFHVIKYEGTFTTIIIAWPSVNDHSKLAGAVRIIAFIAWGIFLLRVSAVSYGLVTPVTIGLSHKFKTVRGYFYSLNDIFKGNEEQKVKEQRYEEGFKIGIQWHIDILRCTKLVQKTLAIVFGGQIIINLIAFSILLIEFVNAERTLANVVSILTTTVALLFSTGCFMWNAGDISEEASSLCTAMFESGWHNCGTKALVKVRSMVVIAMWQSQRPVQLHCLGVVQLSYGSYLTIVKSSYSVFSLLY